LQELGSSIKKEVEASFLTISGISTKDAPCWGPSASEGPQKQDLTVFLEYNV
jgi:hypothetical protein